MENKDQSVQQCSLEDVLTNAGLDAKFWFEKIKSELGITSARQLKFVSSEELETLSKHARFKWEKSALREILKPTENIAQNQTDAIGIMNEAATKLSTAAKNINERENKTMDELSKRLDQSVDQLYPTASKDSEKRTKMMLEELKKNRSEMSDKHVEVAGSCRSNDNLNRIKPSIVATVSGGTLLRGTLLSKNLDDMLVKRRQLIQITGNIQFSGTDIPSTTEQAEFYSKERSDLFTRCLGTSGITFAMSQLFDRLGASCKSEASLKGEQEKDKTQESKTEETFASSIKYFIRPMCSVQLTSTMLTLSDEAIDSLQDMEKQIINSTENERQNMCTRFFSKYGSHGNIGLVHLGGIYILETTFQGKTKTSHEQIKTMCMALSNAFANVGQSALSIKSGTAISADTLCKQASKENQFNDKDIAQTRLSCRMYGGSPLASSMAEWQTSLSEDETTWIVIDKGQGQDYDYNNYIGVWELLKNQSASFKDFEKLFGVLSSSYNKMTDASIDANDMASYSLEHFSSVIKQITTDALNTGCLNMYCDALEKLVAELHNLEKNVGNAKPWVKLLQSDDYISDFLLLPMSSQKHCFIGNRRLRSIRQNVGVLMEPAKGGETEMYPKIGQIFEMIQSESYGRSTLMLAFLNTFFNK